ncbi:MAG: hypothetical protein MUF18_01535 [Fimbriiglobus sp.]|jgi:hypothetical protein|nr:hypothetical protein [Fimbriiglobus sp.]
MKLTSPRPKSYAGHLVAELPGPDRKRTPAEYRYHLTYRNPHPTEDGCMMVWEVLGGRLPYQIACERTAKAVRWHCTCADAVYREDEPQHRCKHVRGLIDTLDAVSVVPACVG